MGAYGLSITVDGIPGASTAETERGCADWITFTPATFELAPDEVQIVEGLVHAPKDAVGGYSAFLTAEFRMRSQPFMLDEEEKLQAQLDLGRAVSSVLLVTTRSSKNFATLEPDSLVLSSGRGSPKEMVATLSGSVIDDAWQASLMVTNTGNVHTLATGEISIWREDASLVERADLTAGRGFVLPGRKRLFTAKGERSLADGIYMAKVQLRTKEGRLVQGTFPYSIVEGEAVSGAASDGIRALLKATAPAFSLSKRMLDYKITPGGKRTQGITLKNYSPDSLTVLARAVDWTMDEDGKVVLRPDPAILVRPCTSWLSVSPNPILIPPKRSKSVRVTVTAPPELYGEYYSAVVFETPESGEPLPTEFELPRTLLMTVSSAQGLEYQAEIDSFYHEPVSSLMRIFVVNVLNTGNTHCFASGKLEIYDLKFNMVMERIPFGGPHDYILPDRIRGYAVPCPGALDPGRYEAVVVLDYQDGADPVISKIHFEAGGQ
ncbi:MAG: hypothetical protein KAW67_07425 [Candidatus Eisenbacteria sp.]|nr:hypothetical protein [Candidatus Eisenbacteria bacterium]